MNRGSAVGTREALPTYLTVVPLASNTTSVDNDAKVSVADAALSRPLALPSATTTMLTLSVNVTDTDALVPLTEVVAAIGVLSDAFLTCTAVTPDATVYVMLAVVPEYVTPPQMGCFAL